MLRGANEDDARDAVDKLTENLAVWRYEAATSQTRATSSNISSLHLTIPMRRTETTLTPHVPDARSGSRGSTCLLYATRRLRISDNIGKSSRSHVKACAVRNVYPDGSIHSSVAGTDVVAAFVSGVQVGSCMSAL